MHILYYLCKFVQGLLSSTAEVAALCGFVFGVACKLPSSLVILLLNGVVWVVIAQHLIWDIHVFYKKKHHRTENVDTENLDTENLDTENLDTENLEINPPIGYVMPLMETIALLMQLSTLIAIPILLAFTEVNYENTDKYMTVYILIPITLTVISVVWSGWIQNYLVKPRSDEAKNDAKNDARMKSGE